ncbi:hypothetical protein ACIB24_16695 [Spongisporangium articulatum]|uniref:Lipoprotein n=1 Tax=Spongisporangium articulatum TaxID=3362603 RepID=A0ABW8AQQ7_9ACTN
MGLSTRTSSALTSLAALLVAGLVLSGCSGQEAGAAAVVGDRRITIAQVQSAYTDVVPLVGQDAQFTQSDILNWLILEPYLTQEAAHEGKGVSVQDAKLEFTKVEGAPRDPSPAALAVVRAILARGAVFANDKSTEELTALLNQITGRLKADGVKLNPRYGSSMDYTQANIVKGQPNWLKPVATPSATPAQ